MISHPATSMRNLAVLVIHLIATLARLLGPGSVRSLGTAFVLTIPWGGKVEAKVQKPAG